LIFEAGNPASVIANTVVWVTETANKELSTGLSEVNALATAAQWQGFGALASMVASNGLNLGLQTLVGWTAHKIAVTQAAVEAFTLAASSVIPSLVSITNRAETQVLNATNFMGINTPAIIERETEYYGEHWPHNSSAGWAYASVLSTLSAALTMPPPAAPMGASPAAPAAAGEALAQAAGQSGMNDVAQLTGQTGQAAGQTAAAPAEAGGQASPLLQPMQLISGMTQPLQQLVSAPMRGIQGLTSMPQGLMSSMSGLLQSGGASNAAAEAGAVAEPVLAGGGAAGGLGGASVGGGGGLGGFPGAGLTSYTRPTSSFEPEAGGRPGSLRAGLLNAAEVRGPTAPAGMGGSPMPVSPAGMLARRTGSQSEKDAVTRVRVVVGGDRTDSD
jgi:PPE-repeat protein